MFIRTTLRIVAVGWNLPAWSALLCRWEPVVGDDEEFARDGVGEKSGEDRGGDIVGCHRMFDFQTKAEKEQSAVASKIYYTVLTITRMSK